MKSWLILAFILTVSTSAFACSEDGSTGFAPEDGTPIPVNSKSAKGINEAAFNRVIDRGVEIYGPEIARLGGKLEVERRWSDATANAFAKRSGRTWHVVMFGGLARHEAITEDGFALVLCHEIGHHIGGAPKVKRLFGLMRWASNEGQADYFATLKCLRRMFLNDNNSAIVARMSIPAALRTSCTKQHGRGEEAALCMRTAMAGHSTATWLGRGKPVSFDTPDAAAVGRTNDAHPAAQCRLDTFFQGSLCEKAFTEEVSQSNEVQGTCHATTGHQIGLRPNCWFKPAVL